MQKTVTRSVFRYREEALRRGALACITGSALFIAACSDPGKSAGSSASAAPSGSSIAPPTTSAAGASAAPSTSDSPVPEGVDLLKLVLASGVKSKDPVDKLDHATPGKRVYAHATIRNRTSGKKRVTVSFRINDDERTMVDLEIGQSWSWRTWAYVTLRNDDKGELTVHIFDDHGAALGTQSIPIR